MRYLSLLSSILVLCLWAGKASLAHAAKIDQVPAVWPTGGPDPLPSLYDANDILFDHSIEEFAGKQPASTRFETRIVTLKEDGAVWGGTQTDPLYFLSFHLGWSRRRWVKDLTTADQYEEVWRREVIIGVPLILLAICAVLLVVLAVIEVHYRRYEEYHYVSI